MYLCAFLAVVSFACPASEAFPSHTDCRNKSNDTDAGDSIPDEIWLASSIKGGAGPVVSVIV